MVEEIVSIDFGVDVVIGEDVVFDGGGGCV